MADDEGNVVVSGVTGLLLVVEPAVDKLTNGDACLGPKGAGEGFGANGFVGVTIFCCGKRGV